MGSGDRLPQALATSNIKVITELSKGQVVSLNISRDRFLDLAGHYED